MNIYSEIKKFKKKYPLTLAFRVKRHAEVIERHLNPGEEVRYAFTAQKNNVSMFIPNTFVVVLTNKRLLFGRKRLLFGYFFYAITPDMFNDLKVNSGIIWGRITIDTIKELINISNIDIKALDEVETNITEYMMTEKKNYNIVHKDSV